MLRIPVRDGADETVIAEREKVPVRVVIVDW